MIYTDGTHIISDAGLQELHWFAARAGIGKWYFEKTQYGKPKGFAAYKLYAAGARFVKAEKIVEILRTVKYFI